MYAPCNDRMPVQYEKSPLRLSFLAPIEAASVVAGVDEDAVVEVVVGGAENVAARRECMRTPGRMRWDLD